MDQDAYSLELQSVEQKLLAPGVEEALLNTNGGVIRCIWHRTDGYSAVLWVGGAGGGLDGPAGGMYPRLAQVLSEENIASLRLDYRHPNELAACTLDTLIGVAFLQKLNFQQVVLVGHSFGGAVVITAGANSEAVVGIVALSSQNAGTELVTELSPRPLLLIHGEADRVLPYFISEEIYRRAKEPKQIRLYPGCGHGLDECRTDMERNVLQWLREVLI